ncbi:unnamed protein product [Closterium sp. NIES-64]|nr:unnamed protein product [Closterium sp. NIES-64]
MLAGEVWSGGMCNEWWVTKQRLGVAFNPRSNTGTELPPTMLQRLIRMAMCCLPKQVVPRECCYAAIQLSSLLAPRPLSPLLPSPLSAPLLSPPLSSLRPSPLSAPLISPPFSSLRSSPLLAPPLPHGWQGRTAAVQGPMLIFDFACCSVVAWNDCPLLALPPFLSPGMAGPDSIGAGAHVYR